MTGHAAEPFADLAETHSAVVYFAGDHAFKLKKPVDLGFLDFRTLQARAAACQRETELNRRFAPDVYLGVAEVRDPAGQVCDHLVVMRRMPADRRLSSRIAAGEPVDNAIRQVARILAAQHASAARGGEISADGSRDALWGRWNDNFEQLGQVRGDLVSERDITAARRLADRFLAGREPLFDARVRAGRILDGHGDLRADDIFCLDDGPRILDCLEFDDHLRWLDGLDDAGFLAMDLERLGAADLAGRFTRWYVEYSGDRAPPSLLHHYIAYRAVVRVKVGCIRAAQDDGESAAEVRQVAAVAVSHLRAGAVALVLVGGLPGTGKSTLAGEIAGRLGCTVLSSDRIRKELAGIPPEQPAPAVFGAGIYTTRWTERTYAELLRRASELLAAGESVIADATWTSAGHRQAAALVAGRVTADLVQLECVLPRQLAAHRIASRTRDSSDASPAIAAELAAAREPWPEAVVLDTSARAAGSDQPSEAVRQALSAIVPDDPPCADVRP